MSLRSHLVRTFTRFLPERQRTVMSEFDVGDVFIAKQFITHSGGQPGAGDDAWAVYSLHGANDGPAIDIKFVQTLSRQYQFSADSFQILLDGGQMDARLQHLCGAGANDSTPAPAKDSTPTYHYRSSYADPAAALQHLSARHIAVSSESDIAHVFGGGLLKYARFLARGWTVAPGVDQHKLQRYMCTRFMMDYPYFQLTRFGVPAQLQRVCDFVEMHLPGHDSLRPLFFTKLEQIITEAAVPDTPPLLKAVYHAGFIMMQAAQAQAQAHPQPPPQPRPQPLPQPVALSAGQDKSALSKAARRKGRQQAKGQPKAQASKHQLTTTEAAEQRNPGRSGKPLQQVQVSVGDTPAPEEGKTAIVTNVAAEAGQATIEIVELSSRRKTSAASIHPQSENVPSPSKKKRTGSSSADPTSGSLEAVGRSRSYAAALFSIGATADVEPVR